MFRCVDAGALWIRSAWMVLKLPCIACAQIVLAQHVLARTKSLLIPTAAIAHTVRLQLSWQTWMKPGTSSWTMMIMSREDTARMLLTLRGASSISLSHGMRGCLYRFSSSSRHAQRTNCTSGTSLYTVHTGYIQYIHHLSLPCRYLGLFGDHIVPAILISVSNGYPPSLLNI